MDEFSRYEKRKIFKEVCAGNISTLVEIKRNDEHFHWTQLALEKSGDTVLHYAVRFGHPVIVEYLLIAYTPCGVNCKSLNNKTALHEAAQFAQYSCALILINHGAEINCIKQADWTPLMLSCTKTRQNDSFMLVELLLKNNALVNFKNKDGWNALHLICREGDIRILNLLLNFNAPILDKTNNGRTVLHISALHGKLDIVKTLVTKGIDIDEKDSCGNTPLHDAVSGGNIELLKFLIASKGQVFSTTNENFNLLHIAASEGHCDICYFLVKSLKFDVNKQTKNGFGALHCAARKNHLKTYEFLVSCGAKEDMKDNFERTAWDYVKL